MGGLRVDIYLPVRSNFGVFGPYPHVSQLRNLSSNSLFVQYWASKRSRCVRIVSYLGALRFLLVGRIIQPHVVDGHIYKAEYRVVQLLRGTASSRGGSSYLTYIQSFSLSFKNSNTGLSLTLIPPPSLVLTILTDLRLASFLQAIYVYPGAFIHRDILC